MNRYSYNIFKHKKITLDINRTELSCWMILENSLKYKDKNTLRIYTVHTFISYSINRVILELKFLPQ